VPKVNYSDYETVEELDIIIFDYVINMYSNKYNLFHERFCYMH